MTDATDTMEGGKGLLICEGYDNGYYFFFLGLFEDNGSLLYSIDSS